MSGDGAKILELGAAFIWIIAIGLPLLYILAEIIGQAVQRGFKATMKDVFRTIILGIVVALITFGGLAISIVVSGSILFGVGKILGLI